MTIEQIEKRLNEIKVEIENATAEQIVAAVAEKSNLSKKDAEKVINKNKTVEEQFN